jgi:hypothetical protein
MAQPKDRLQWMSPSATDAACTGKERVVPRLDASGVLIGEPWTWMRPEWAGHDVWRRVEFRWNGTRFMEQWVVLK